MTITLPSWVVALAILVPTMVLSMGVTNYLLERFVARPLRRRWDRKYGPR